MADPLILVTNDDGVHAPGVRALAAALGSLGEVWIVAPDREVSASGQSLTLTHPLRAESIEPNVVAVDGTPADCVNLAIVKLLPRAPAVVVSGINRGGNLGDDIFYSGTVGAAREATFFGLPAIAVSLASRAEADYGPAAEFARKLVALVKQRGLPERTLLNVNVPAGQPKGVAVTVQGRRSHEGTILEGLDPRHRTYYWIEEGRDQWVSDEMSDIFAVRSGLISVSPLQTDTTNHRVIGTLREWERELQGGGGDGAVTPQAWRPKGPMV
jgi:5'-nucleotidase